MCMNTSASNVDTRRTIKVNATSVVQNSPITNQDPRFHPSVNSELARKLNHWCRGCGTYMTNPDGLCAKCRKPLVKEYKALQQTPDRIGLASSLIAEGYEQHFNAIDAEVARETPCKLCGKVCYYIGLKKGSSYRAISRCTGCGNEYEF